MNEAIVITLWMDFLLPYLGIVQKWDFLNCYY